MLQTKNKYDLEERTAKFGERILDLCKTIQQDTLSRPILDQLARSATSIGANYMEANGASSKKDFRSKIFICKKEAQETKHWLRMLARILPEKYENLDGLRRLWQEAQELTMIFYKVTVSLKNKNVN